TSEIGDGPLCRGAIASKEVVAIGLNRRTCGDLVEPVATVPGHRGVRDHGDGASERCVGVDAINTVVREPRPVEARRHGVTGVEAGHEGAIAIVDAHKVRCSNLAVRRWSIQHEQSVTATALDSAANHGPMGADGDAVIHRLTAYGICDG